MKIQKDAPESFDNPVIDLLPIDDAALATVTGGRDYGWRGGGWGTNAKEGVEGPSTSASEAGLAPST